MQKNNILILDDEHLACSYLKECIETFIVNHPTFNDFTVHATSRINDFWQKLKEFQPAIIFLDIEMPGKNGIEIAQDLKNNIKKFNYLHEPIIIFCTAYDNYAYQAFTLNAVDYLLKPATEDKIQSVFEKISNHYKNYLENIYEYVYVTNAGVELKLPLKDIIYFKAEMKYISVITSKKEFLLNDTLLNLEKKYDKFLKIHRAFLINPLYIQKFYRKDNHWFVTIKNDLIVLPVSRRQKHELENKIDYKTFLVEYYDSDTEDDNELED